jgi:uncharacterized membrane protein YphA (DoxX/SURF4 family)
MFAREQEIGPALTRIGVAVVFLVFGVWQFVDPVSWYGYLPASLPFGLSPATALYLNGALDVLLGVALILGIFARIVAIIAAVHLAIITSTLGWNDVTVRDLGLVIVLLGVAIYGTDRWCLEKKFRT